MLSQWEALSPSPVLTWKPIWDGCSSQNRPALYDEPPSLHWNWMNKMLSLPCRTSTVGPGAHSGGTRTRKVEAAECFWSFQSDQQGSMCWQPVTIRNTGHFYGSGLEKNWFSGWRDGSAVKSTDWLFRRSRVQIPATTWWLTTIHNEIWCPLLGCLKTATVYLHIIINK